MKKTLKYTYFIKRIELTISQVIAKADNQTLKIKS